MLLIMQLLRIIGLLVVPVLAQDENCGSQLESFRECGRTAKSDNGIAIDDNLQNITLHQIRQCWKSGGCQNPTEVLEELYYKLTRAIFFPPWMKDIYVHWYGWPEWLYQTIAKTMHPRFSQCVMKNVVRKIVFPAVATCLGEKFSLEDYQLPKLHREFKARKIPQFPAPMPIPARKKRESVPVQDSPQPVQTIAADDPEVPATERPPPRPLPPVEPDEEEDIMSVFETGDPRIIEAFIEEIEYAVEQNNVLILAASMAESDLFNIHNPEIAHDVLWQSGEIACNGSREKEDNVGECIKEVSRDYWSSQGQICANPVKKAAIARDNFKSYCLHKQDCYDLLENACKYAFKEEPQMLCNCAYELPLKSDIRIAVKEELMGCFNFTDTDLEENYGLSFYLYDSSLSYLEVIAGEFCILQQKNPCKKEFGDDLEKVPEEEKEKTFLDILKERIDQLRG